MVKLSKRLQAIADLVPEGLSVADVGTDHGYIPIWLVSCGRIPGAVAMDVNEGPLMRARTHIHAEGLDPYIQTRLSDGVQQLLPGEAACVIIAGMGGGLVQKILREGVRQLEDVKYLILQPQSEVSGVRKYLREHGFEIRQENMVMEDGKYYPMMLALSEKKEAETDSRHILLEDAFGPLLLHAQHPVLEQWLLREDLICKKILARLPDTEPNQIRRSEILKRQRQAKDALRLFYGRKI